MPVVEEEETNTQKEESKPVEEKKEQETKGSNDEKANVSEESSPESTGPRGETASVVQDDAASGVVEQRPKLQVAMFPGAECAVVVEVEAATATKVGSV